MSQLFENKARKNFLSCLTFTHRPKQSFHNTIGGFLWDPPRCERTKRGIIFPQNEAIMLLKTVELPFLEVQESHQVMENTGIYMLRAIRLLILKQLSSFLRRKNRVAFAQNGLIKTPNCTKTRINTGTDGANLAYDVPFVDFSSRIRWN